MFIVKHVAMLRIVVVFHNPILLRASSLGKLLVVPSLMVMFNEVRVNMPPLAEH